MRGPLVALLPATCELWLDGGHNPAAGEALAASLDRADPRPLHLVVGMLSTKDLSGFCVRLAPSPDRCTRCRFRTSLPVVIPSRPPPRRCASAFPRRRRATWPALRAIAQIETGPARVLVCGSLYLAGHVLRENG